MFKKSKEQKKIKTPVVKPEPKEYCVEGVEMTLTEAKAYTKGVLATMIQQVDTGNYINLDHMLHNSEVVSLCGQLAAVQREENVKAFLITRNKEEDTVKQ